ncbi:hypothetical protein DEEACLCL_00148 [Salmonella phage CRW-SP2]|nr:hypothetical protein DEEACLCL_00148 [Salmonella phage CRW-SP2]
MSYPVDTKFTLPRNESDTFLIIQQLLSAGETIQVYKDGKKFGRGISCSISDEGYWAFDFSKMHTEKSDTVSLYMRFLLNQQVDLTKYDLFINPVNYEFRDDGKKFQFGLLVCFNAHLVLKPMFTPPSERPGD